MSWARLDDQMAFHAKIIKAGNEAVGAWVRMITYSCAHLTDGKVTKEVALSIAPQRVVTKAVTAGLLDLDGDGYIVHDFLDWNPPAEVVLEKRRADAERKAKGRMNQRRGDSGRYLPEVPDDVQPDVQSDSEATPSASPPVPSPSPEKINQTNARPTLAPTPQLIDPDWKLNDELRATAEMVGVRDVEGAWLQFIGDRRSKGVVSCDWPGEWQKWAVTARNIERREREREHNRGGGPAKASHIQRPAAGESAWKVGK
jgi:hypothetical protein